MSTIISRLIALLTGRGARPAAEAPALPAPRAQTLTAPIAVAPAAEIVAEAVVVEAAAPEIVVEPRASERAAAEPVVAEAFETADAANAGAAHATLASFTASEIVVTPREVEPAVETAPAPAVSPADTPTRVLRVPASVADAPFGVGPLASRIGGMPWLGAAEFWPHDAEGRPLTFLAQINFAEAPAAAGLPAAGLLRLFVAETETGAVAPEGVVSIFDAAPVEGAIQASPRGSALVNTVYPTPLAFGPAESDAAPTDALARIGGRATVSGDARFDRALVEIRAASAFLPATTDIAVLVPAEKLAAAQFDEMRVALASA